MIQLNRIPNWLVHRCRDFSNSYLENRLIRPAEIFHRITKKKAHSISQLTGGAHSSSSWLVSSDNFQFKLFKLSYNQDSKHFLQVIDILREKGFTLPNIVGFDKAEGYVLSEWLNGTDISIEDIRRRPVLINKIAELQASFHRITDISIESRNPDNFYLTKIVFPRFLHWTEIRFGKKMGERAQKLVKVAAERLYGFYIERAGVITNPDFSLNNLIITPDGEIAVIDTEFICIDSGAEFELANFFERLGHYGEPLVNKYANCYKNFGSLEAYYENRRFWDACVKLRRLGKQAKYFRIDEDVFIQNLQSVETNIYDY